MSSSAFASAMMPSVQGTVRNGETKEAIAGAYVVVVYYADELSSIVAHGGKREICAHVALTRTDQNGHFNFPATKIPESLLYNRATIRAYKAEFVGMGKTGVALNYFSKDTAPRDIREYRYSAVWDFNFATDENDHIEYLWRDPSLDNSQFQSRQPAEDNKSFKAQIDEGYTPRVYHLGQRMRFTCPGIVPRLRLDDQGWVLYPLYRAMYEEASRLAKTKSDESAIRSLCRRALFADSRFNRRPALPGQCDIDAVPDRWKQVATGFLSGTPQVLMTVEGQPDSKVAEPLSDQERRMLNHFIKRASKNTGIPAYPKSRSLALDSDFLGPDDLRKVLKSVRSGSSKLEEHAGFQLVMAPDPIDLVMNYYRNVLKGGGLRTSRFPDGLQTIQIWDSDSKARTVILMRAIGKDETLVVVMRIPEEPGQKKES